MSKHGDIAIIGMSGRFPGANTVERFWENLKNGIDSITLFKGSEKDNKNYIAAKGYIEDSTSFAADFFKFTPKTAEITDPQFRLFLECVWECWENAGYNPEEIDVPVGIYACSATHNSYYEKNIIKNSTVYHPNSEYQCLIHNAKDSLATLVAYKFNFNGPAINIQTACSSSLVAICQACDALRLGQCDMAIAGGISISFPIKNGYLHREGGIYSADGHCKPFSSQATGIVPSNGGGTILLKRYKEAVKDNDNIYAVIKGYASNNDGQLKLNFTAPSIDGQINVLTKAAKNANIDPGTIQYIEAHGTGTPLGDHVEVTALKEYLAKSQIEPKCLIGSVKSNLGHLDVAAGIAGFIKTVLAIKYKTIPKSLYTEQQNTLLDLDHSLSLATKTIPWQKMAYPRRSGISAFGVGGTNAHIIIEEVLEKKDTATNLNTNQLIPLSAENKQNLNKFEELLFEYLKNSNESFADIAYTLQCGRKHFNSRSCWLINKNHKKRTFHSNNHWSQDKITFVFNDDCPVEMKDLVKQLKKENMIFQKYYSSCENIINNQQIEKVSIYQKSRLTLIATQYALYKTYLDLGIIPELVIGYGIGELAAAAAMGVFDFNSAIKLAILYLTMQNDCNQVMLRILNYQQDISELIESFSVKLIAKETMSRHIVSGNKKQIKLLKDHLNSKTIFSSEEIELTKCTTIFSDEDYQCWTKLINSIDFYSQANDRDAIKTTLNNFAYWESWPRTIKNLSSTVIKHFEISSIFLEIGLSNQCCQLIKQINHSLKKPYEIFTISTVENNTASILPNIAKFWVNGINIEWQRLYKKKCKKIPLPSTPLMRKNYCVYPTVQPQEKQQQQEYLANNHSTTIDLPTNYLYEKNWISLFGSSTANVAYELIFVIHDEFSIVKNLLKQSGVNESAIFNIPKITSLPVTDAALKQRTTFWHQHLQKTSHNSKVLILHAATFVNTKNNHSNEYFINNSFYDYVAIAKAVISDSNYLDITILSISNHTTLFSSMLQGPTLCLPLEIPNISTKHIQISEDANLNKAAEQLKQEIFKKVDHPEIKLNGEQQFIPSFQPYKPSDSIEVSLKNQGTYLLIGGLGGIALVLAEYLAEHFHANLILVTKTPIPPKNLWEQTLQKETLDADLKHKLQTLSKIEKVASSISIHAIDITNRQAAEKFYSNLPALNGVIHLASPLPNKTLMKKQLADIKNMLAVKAESAESLIHYFSDKKLDFIILSSSLNTIYGDIAASDYIAANAYLDSLAKNYSKKSMPIISIAWDAWKEAGMKIKHSVKTRNFHHSKTLASFSNSHWQPFIEEHRLNKQMLVPGSLLISLLADVEIPNMPYNFPMTIKETAFINKGIILQPKKTTIDAVQINAPHKHFSIVLNYNQSSTQLLNTTIHYFDTSKLTIKNNNHIITKFLDLAKITKLHDTQSQIELGQRWNCLEWVKKERNNYFAKLSVPQKYRTELKKFSFYPPLLDLAISFHARFLSGQYLPYYIEEMIIYEKIPAEIYSNIEITQYDEAKGLCIANIILLSLTGETLLTIKKLYLKLLTTKNTKPHTKEKNKPNYTHGLSNQEAINCFKSILKAPKPHVIVSKNSLSISERKIVSYNKAITKTSHDDLLQSVKNIWSSTLSVKNINDNADFFDIGGDSLYAIQICYKIKMELKKNVQPDILLEHSSLNDFCKKISSLS